jgi:hypothetical protein
MKGHQLLLLICFFPVYNCLAQMPLGLTLWLKADAGVYSDPINTPASNSTLVYKWEDQSGNGNDFIQTNSNFQPVYKTNVLCSRPALRFEVARKTFLQSSMLMSGAKTAFIVFVMPVMNNAANTFLSIKSNTGLFTEIVATDFLGYRPITFIADLSSTPAGSFYQSSVGVNVSFAAQGNMVCVTYNGGANTSPASYSVNYDNLTPPVSSGGLLGRYTGDGTTIGGRAPAQNINFLNGDLAEIIVFNRVLNSVEISDVSSYLVSKYGLINNCALPVKLKSFDARVVNSTVRLNWKAAEEYNLDRYEVQRSIDGTTWKKIGEVRSLNNGTPADYSFVDPVPLDGWNFFRLAEVNYDGSIEFSSVRKVLFNHQAQMQIFPNPVTNTFTMFGNFSDRLKISIYNSLGVEVKRISCFANQEVPVTDLPKGVYRLKLNSIHGDISMSFVKQ